MIPLIWLPPGGLEPAVASVLPPGPPLRESTRDLLERMASGFHDRPGFAAHATGFSFDNRFARTAVRFTAVDCPVPGGRRVAEIAEVRTTLPDAVAAETGDRDMAVFNTVASLGALLRDPASGERVVVSRAALAAGEEDLLPRLGLLLHAAALGHPEQLITAFMLAEDGQVAPAAAWPRREPGQASPWNAAEFEPVAHQMRRAGYAAWGGATGLTADLAWPAGGGGDEAAAPGPCELVLTTLEPHPLFGDGLFCKLELPVAFTPEQQVAVANALNGLEAQALDGPPCLGAWCAVRKTARIAWVSFLPDNLFRPHLAGQVAAWMVARRRVAWEVLCGRRE